MAWITKLILGILFAIALVLLVLIFSPYSLNYFNDSGTKTADTGTSVKEVTPVELLVIDFPQYESAKLVERIQSGDALILLMGENKAAGNNFYLFNTVQSLAKFSKDKTGYIDLSDPAFRNLMVAQLNLDEKILYYTPIRKSGIAAISIDPGFLSAEILSDPRRYDRSAGNVTFSDSSVRALHVAIIPGHDLEDITFKMQSNQ